MKNNKNEKNKFVDLKLAISCSKNINSWFRQTVKEVATNTEGTLDVRNKNSSLEGFETKSLKGNKETLLHNVMEEVMKNKLTKIYR